MAYGLLNGTNSSETERLLALVLL